MSLGESLRRRESPGESPRESPGESPRESPAASLGESLKESPGDSLRYAPCFPFVFFPPLSRSRFFYFLSYACGMCGGEREKKRNVVYNW